MARNMEKTFAGGFVGLSAVQWLQMFVLDQKREGDEDNYKESER